MVDPQPVERAVREPCQHEPVRVSKDVLVLDPQPDQAVDVEESPVAEVARRRAPVRETEVLALEQRVQQVDAGIHLGDHRVNRPGRVRVLGKEPRERIVEDVLVSVATLDARLIGRRRRGELAERLGDERERFGSRSLGRGRQQHVERLG